MKILYLEDNKDDAEFVIKHVKKVFPAAEIILTAKKDNFENTLYSMPIDLVLADYILPSYSGMDALKACNEKDGNLPFVFITGAIGNEEHAAETILTGATAFVLKNNLDHLENVLKELKNKYFDNSSNLAETLSHLSSSIQLSLDTFKKLQLQIGDPPIKDQLPAVQSKLMVIKKSLERSLLQVEMLLQHSKG